ncbi:MAG: hypothetical protein WCF04_05335 [Candidatus Nanopelagicales bacterium]
MLTAWFLPVGGSTNPYKALHWFGVILTILGIPAMAVLMVRLLLPGADRLRGRATAPAMGAVFVVMAGSSFLGTQHPRLLTCEDFTINGNFAPDGCSPGTGSTVR